MWSSKGKNYKKRSVYPSKIKRDKNERSHRTWKEKIKYDVINSDEELNCVENFPIYQQLYESRILLKGWNRPLKCTIADNQI